MKKRINLRTSAVCLLSGLLLAGCQPTEEEQARIDKAEDNLEKVALSPKITTLAPDETLSVTKTVHIDVDDSVEYDSVKLIVQGVEVGEDLSPPYSFELNPYFWSDDEKISVFAKATTKEGNQLRSDIVSVSIDPSAKDLLTLEQPSLGQPLRNLEEINLHWTSLPEAVKYEVKVNDKTLSTDLTQETVSLPELGSYSISLRATDKNSNAGAWTTAVVATLAGPNTPTINATSAESNDGFELQISLSDTLKATEVQIAANDSFSGAEVFTPSGSSLVVPATVGNYYIRARTTNELNQTSAWTDSTEVSVGLFAFALNTVRGYSNYSSRDNVTDITLKGDDLAFLVNGRTYSYDNSGDGLIVASAKLPSGEKNWLRSMQQLGHAPRKIAKSSTGFLVTARKKGSYTQDILLKLDDKGNLEWSKDLPEGEMKEGSDTKATRVSHGDIIELLNKKILLESITENLTYKDMLWRTDSRDKLLSLRSESGDLLANIPIDDNLGYSGGGGFLLETDNLYLSYMASKDGKNTVNLASLNVDNGKKISQLQYKSNIDGDLQFRGIVKQSNGDLVVLGHKQGANLTIFDSNSQSQSTIQGGALTSITHSNITSLSNGGFAVLGYSQEYPKYIGKAIKYNTNYTEQTKLDLSKFGTHFYLLKTEHHDKYGTIVVGTNDRLQSDGYIVVFNISDDLQYTIPSKVIEMD